MRMLTFMSLTLSGCDKVCVRSTSNCRARAAIVLPNKVSILRFSERPLLTASTVWRTVAWSMLGPSSDRTCCRVMEAFKRAANLSSIDREGSLVMLETREEAVVSREELLIGSS